MALQNLAIATDEVTHLSSLRQQRTETRQVVSRTLSVVTAWAKDMPAGALQDVDPPTPTLTKGEDLMGAIKRYRAQADELRLRLKAIAKAPITVAMAKEKMRQEVAELAARGRPQIGHLIKSGGKIVWPVQTPKRKFTTSRRRLLASSKA